MGKDTGASMTVNYTGYRPPEGMSVDEILHLCRECGHARADHYHERGRCTWGHQKRITRCQCTRYRGR